MPRDLRREIIQKIVSHLRHPLAVQKGRTVLVLEIRRPRPLTRSARQRFDVDELGVSSQRIARIGP